MLFTHDCAADTKTAPTDPVNELPDLGPFGQSCGDYLLRRRIGKGLLLSTGAKITGGEILCDHIIIAASSIVAKSFPDGNALFVGCRL